MNAALRTRVRHAIDQAARHLCPSCGEFKRRLVQATGFCTACTNEHERGGPVNPGHSRKYT